MASHSHSHSHSSPTLSSFVLRLSLLTLALPQECLSLYTHRPSFEPAPDLLLVQYNITILGGPSVAQVNVVFSLCANLQNKRKSCVDFPQAQCCGAGTGDLDYVLKLTRVTRPVPNILCEDGAAAQQRCEVRKPKSPIAEGGGITDVWT